MTTIRALTLTVSLIGLTFHSVGGYAKPASAEQVLKGLRDALPHTKFADDVYKDKSDIKGWKIKEYSNTETGFYARTYQKGNEVVVAFRGTDKKRVDWTHLDDQVSDAFDLALKVSGDESIKKLTFTGHSLGGGLAQFAAAMANKNNTFGAQINGSTFNALEIRDRVRDSLRRALGNEALDNLNIQNICTSADIIACRGGRNNIGSETIIIPGIITVRNTAIEHLKNIVKSIIKKGRRSSIVIKNHELATVINQMKIVIEGASFFDFEYGKDRIIVKRTKQRKTPSISGMDGDTNGGNSMNGAASMHFDNGNVDTPADDEEKDKHLNDQNTEISRYASSFYFDGEILTGNVEIISFHGGNAENFFSHFTGQGDTTPFAYPRFSLPGDRSVTTLIKEGTDGPRFHAYTTPDNGISAPQTQDGWRIPDADNFGEEGLYQVYIHDYDNRHQRDSTDLANSETTVSIEQNGVVVVEYNVPNDGQGNTWQAIGFDTGTGIIGTTNNFKDITEPEDVPFNDPAVNSPITDRDTLKRRGEVISGDGL